MKLLTNILAGILGTIWLSIILAAIFVSPTTLTQVATASAPTTAATQKIKQPDQRVVDECMKKIETIPEYRRKGSDSVGYDLIHYVSKYCGGTWWKDDSVGQQCYEQIRSALSGTRAYLALDSAVAVEWARYQLRYCGNLPINFVN